MDVRHHTAARSNNNMLARFHSNAVFLLMQVYQSGFIRKELITVPLELSKRK